MAHKPNIPRKLILAGLSVLGSVAVLGTASFAWLTLSTNPEISGMQMTLGGDKTVLISIDNAQTFHRTVDISSKFRDIQTLRPVSTVDGLNWYVCDYDVSTGNIKETDFFPVAWCDEPEEHETEPEHQHCSNGFYAYTDIWVKTEATSANVRLSVPDDSKYYGEESASGSYLLSYATTEKSTEELPHQVGIQIMERGPETCARVGLMVFDPTTGETEPVVLGEKENAADKNLTHTFFIYEPNADSRSELDKQSDRYNTDIYVSMLKIKGFESTLDYDVSHTKQLYIPTYPIGNAEAPPADAGDALKTVTAYPTVFNADNLIVQRTAKWNLAAIQGGETTLSFWDEAKSLLRFTQSSDILDRLLLNQYISPNRFVSASYIKETLYQGKTVGSKITTQNTPYAPKVLTADAAPATSQLLFNLKKGEIRQIRLYFWVEGQDVDCWNDVAGMNFLSRLEFATEVVQE